MKLLFENWRKYLKEDEQGVATFDFDDTLAISHWDDEKGFIHDRENQEMIDRLMDYHKKGFKIYIVTSRSEEKQDENGKWYSFNPKIKPPERYIEDYQMPVQKFVEQYKLPIQDVIFTSGQSKIETLKGLHSKVHHDDDPGDILDARANNIKAVISDPYGDYEELEASELQQRREGIGK